MNPLFAIFQYPHATQAQRRFGTTFAREWLGLESDGSFRFFVAVTHADAVLIH